METKTDADDYTAYCDAEDLAKAAGLIEYDSQILIDMADSIFNDMSFMLIPSQRNEMTVALTVAYKQGKAAGLQEAIELIRGA